MDYPDVTNVGAILSDAGKSIDQAMGALGNGDSIAALARLSRALGGIIKAMGYVRQDAKHHAEAYRKWLQTNPK